MQSLKQGLGCIGLSGGLQEAGVTERGWETEREEMPRFIIEFAAGGSRDLAGEKNIFKRLTSQVGSDAWGLSRHTHHHSDGQVRVGGAAGKL